MNERLQELARQAGLEFDDDLVLEPEAIYYTTQKDLEKFAELIVQECIDAVYDDGQDAEYYQDRIKRRFGVEE
jgi:hypothetical protein